MRIVMAELGTLVSAHVKECDGDDKGSYKIELIVKGDTPPVDAVADMVSESVYLTMEDGDVHDEPWEQEGARRLN